MDKKNIITFLFLNVAYFSSFSQDYFVKSNKDTVKCSELEFSTQGQGKISDLSYKDKNGKPVVLKKKSEIPDIITLFIGGITFDRMPLDLDKPDSYYRYGERIIDGKIKLTVYDNQRTVTYFEQKSIYNPKGDIKTSTFGTYTRHIKMPDGNTYNVTTKTLKKVIRPFLFQCAEFQKYHDDVLVPKNASFEESIEAYNKMCK